MQAFFVALLASVSLSFRVQSPPDENPTCVILADEARDACLRFALTDEFYVGERHHDANPWYYPCSPNASGSGRMVMTILGKH